MPASLPGEEERPQWVVLNGVIRGKGRKRDGKGGSIKIP